MSIRSRNRMLYRAEQHFANSLSTPSAFRKFIRLARALFSLAIVGWSLPSAAQPSSADATPPPSLQILLSNQAGAPTPTQVVSGFQSGTMALSGFSVSGGSPQSVTYLLQSRAQGDFLSYLQTHPGTARAKLERFIVAIYASTGALQKGLAALKRDANVEAVAVTPDFRFSSAQLQSFTVDTSASAAPIVGNQYGRDDLNIDSAWDVAGGHALIADLDTGLATSHPDLQAFSAVGQFLGGNFLPAYAQDIGSVNDPNGTTPTDSTNVDEEKAVAVSGTNCDDGTGYAKTSVAGHGTHVAGLIAANSMTVDGLAGTCESCGISEWKISYYQCQRILPGASYVLLPVINLSAISAGITAASDLGVQVINESFGGASVVNYCQNNPGDATCIAIQHATSLDIVISASSGNNRTQIQFPASDPHVIAAGGFQENVAFWDDSPGSNTYCPPTSETKETLGSECGSNYTTSTTDGEKKQELVGSAHDVLSTIYPGAYWNLYGCGDNYGPGTSTDGIGWCTGTSMSSPQIAGVVGILRSINPLVLTGDPAMSGGLGVRNVLVDTTFEAQAGIGWDPRFGYGHPDAAAAARMMLGKADGVTVRNRATPLFSLYSSVAQDYAYTTSPQLAVSYLRGKASVTGTTPTYTTIGSTISGYTAFPNDPLGGSLPPPKADIFVLSTEYKPHPSDPNLVPLYLVHRARAWPLGCTSGPTCNLNHHDTMLVTTVADLQQVVATAPGMPGYDYRGIQGYIYAPCTPETKCIPPYAQHLWRECNPSTDDCAIFLDSAKPGMEAQGYTTAYPAGSSRMLGYAFPNVDSDGDGLVDGFEYVIGTNPLLTDSDGDGVSDSAEFPLATVSTRDPCSGPLIQCPGDDLFKNGFEP